MDKLYQWQCRVDGRFKILRGRALKDLEQHEHFGKSPHYWIWENLEGQWPPYLSSSIGPDNGNCNFVATTLYWLIQFSWDKKSNDQQLKRKLFTLCGSLMLSHIVVLSWPSGWELGSWLMITLMKPSLKCNEWRLRTVVSLSVLNIKVVFIKLGNHLMNYDHQRWLFLTSMYS